MATYFVGMSPMIDEVGDLCPITTSPFSSATATTSNWYNVELIKLSIVTGGLGLDISALLFSV